MGKERFEVSGSRSKYYLMAIDLFVLDNQCDIAELFFIEDVDEVFFHVIIVSCAHNVVSVSVILSTCAFLSDGGEASNVLQTLVWLILLL